MYKRKANGSALADVVVDLQVGPILEVVSPLLLDPTPAVLSVGRRCLKDGDEFYWGPFELPCMVAPKGSRVDLEVEGDVPYLNESSRVVACPAFSSSSGSSSGGAPRGDTPDRWETRADGTVARVHNVPRAALFLPHGFADIPRPIS